MRDIAMRVLQFFALAAAMTTGGIAGVVFLLSKFVPSLHIVQSEKH
jgi:hypothetical protein